MSSQVAPQNNPNLLMRRHTLALLREQFPDSPFLALGQSVFWDEPVKAVLSQVLEQENLGGKLIAGVHDTDYFAKANLRSTEMNNEFALIPHNGGTTRDLWSAAGEISALFGSETYPTRHDFVKYGVGFERAVKAHGASRQDYLDEITEAWGWRGLVYTGSRDLIVSQLPLHEVGEGILKTLKWAFDETLKQIAVGCCHDEAHRMADAILEQCQEFCEANPDASLSDLFQSLLPQFHTLLLQKAPQHMEVAATSTLLRFTPETSHLPRFRFVNLFLDPKTSQIALNAYNSVMDGSGMYTLDRFGENALPFDVVLPERGRGTLRVTPRVLFVETKSPVAIPLESPIQNVAQLAEALNSRFGSEVTLVGKAVSLVSMLAQEFIFVFNEEGSLYVTRTKRMNDLLRDAGIELEMRPILRMKYATWDALGEANTSLKPTEHLAQTFGRKTLSAPEFAEEWKPVLEAQRAILETLTSLKKPREVMAFFGTIDFNTDWEAKLTAYESAQNLLCTLREEGEALQVQVNTLYAELKTVRERLSQCGLEERKPLLVQRKNLLNRVTSLKAERLSIERGERATQARNLSSDLLNEVELARVRLVRNALLTIEGLSHTSHRPSFWWFPLVDSSGGWYRRLIETTEMYTQAL